MKKIPAALLCSFLLLTALASCSEQGSAQGTTPPSPPASASPTISSPSPSPEVTDGLSVAFLKGPTGMGAAYFMEQSENGKLDDDYDILLEADPTVVTSGLISGELDIAAVPTNVACTLYNKTNGNVKLAAINTMGVLYILEKGNTISSAGDLFDKTVYATGQGSNPEYVLNYILSKYDLIPGENITVEYLPSDELAARMASGELEVCMLPVPAATSVLLKNKDVREALNLTDEWSAVSGDGSILTQGCIVYRSDKVSEAQMSSFLEDYSESIEYMTDTANLDAAAELTVKHEIVASDAVAKAALPKCGITFITGADEMRENLAGYFRVLFAADPKSIGGSVPDDAFYREG